MAYIVLMYRYVKLSLLTYFFRNTRDYSCQTPEI